MLQDVALLPHVYLYLFIGIVALAVGSLLNVIIYRLPLMLQAEWRKDYCEYANLPHEQGAPINLFFPRSFCTHCNTQISAWDNIPLFSFCLLLGRCRHCKHPIPWRYPLVELLSVALSLLAAWHFGFNGTLLFALLFIWCLICMSFIDLKHQLLPDQLTLGLLWIGLIANTQSLFTTLPDAVLSAAAAYTGLWLFIKLFYLFTGKIGMGHGDFKLFAAFGAWFGWTQLPLILFLSSLVGAVVGIIYLQSSGQSRQTPVPFGPFLCAAGLLSLFMGHELIQWYLRYF